MSELKPRLITGAILRGQMKRLRALGWLDDVSANVSEATRNVMAKPPISLAKVPAYPTDDVARAVMELHGREAARDLSYHVNRDNTGPLVVPLVRSLLHMFGSTPHTVFGNLATLSAQMTRNIDFAYEKRGPDHGAVIISHEEPAGAPWFIGWEGVFVLGLELASAKGEVWPFEADPDGKRAVFRVRWEEKKKN
ncbi:MAG: hypothetical protein JST54_25460 [Deltaproteobacteria bacterium]|nr:hypothetical protein [Deltaproteobacteria bacterium]